MLYKKERILIKAAKYKNRNYETYQFEEELKDDDYYNEDIDKKHIFY